MNKVHLLPPGKAMRYMGDVQVALLRADSVLSMMHQGGAEVDLLSDLCYALGCVIGVDVKEVRYGQVDGKEAFEALRKCGYGAGLALAMAFGLFCCCDDDTTVLEVLAGLGDDDKADAARYILMSPRAALDSFCSVAQWALSFARFPFQGPMEMEDMVHVADMTYMRLDGAVIPRIVLGPVSYVDYTPGVTQTTTNNISDCLKRLPIIPIIDDGRSSDAQLEMLCKTQEHRKALKDMHTLWPRTFDCEEFVQMLPKAPISTPTNEAPFFANATILSRLSISIARRLRMKRLKIKGLKTKQDRGWTRKVNLSTKVPPRYSVAKIDIGIDPSVPKKREAHEADETVLNMLMMLKANVESDTVLADEAYSEMLTISWHVHRCLVKQGKEAGPDDMYPVLFACMDKADFEPSVCAYIVQNCGFSKIETRQCLAGLELARIGLDFILE